MSNIVKDVFKDYKGQGNILEAQIENINLFKKSKKIEEAGIQQVKYYLYYLQKKEVFGIKAKIDYPLLKKTLEVELSQEDSDKMENILEQIREIVDKDIPPVLQKKNICKSCAYFDLCFIWQETGGYSVWKEVTTFITMDL